MPENTFEKGFFKVAGQFNKNYTLILYLKVFSIYE
jgi:hypothetical protein